MNPVHTGQGKCWSQHFLWPHFRPQSGHKLATVQARDWPRVWPGEREWVIAQDKGFCTTRVLTRFPHREIQGASTKGVVQKWCSLVCLRWYTRRARFLLRVLCRSCSRSGWWRHGAVYVSCTREWRHGAVARYLTRCATLATRGTGCLNKRRVQQCAAHASAPPRCSWTNDDRPWRETQRGRIPARMQESCATFARKGLA